MTDTAIRTPPVSFPSSSAEQRERLSFFAMAVALGVVVVIAFSAFLANGYSSFGAPWWVHVHAVSFMGWIAFYVLQNYLVLNNRITDHRKLGVVGAALAVWLALVGFAITYVAVALDRVAPFFAPAFFLAMDWTNIAVFAALFFAAFHYRKRTDWHRRLMLCATICVIAPAWGRVLVMSTGYVPMWILTLLLLAHVAIGMLADWRIRGRVHAAYVVGSAAIVGMWGLIEALAVFPPVQILAERIAGLSS